MKILLCGSLSNYAIEKHYFKYLKITIKGEIDIFTSQNIFLDYYNKSILNKIKFRLGYKKIYNKINKLLLLKVSNFRPDIIFIFKGMEIYPETLIMLHNLGIYLINYNPDNPFIFSGKGSGNRNISESIPLYDLHFTYDNYIFNKLQQYPVESAILPFGFDLSDSEFQIIKSTKEIKKVCFIGNPDLFRANFIKELSFKVPIVVYGNDWENFIPINRNIQIFKFVYGIEFWKALRKYRVQLNIMRPHNMNSHNMRSFEVPGAGGIGLFPDTPDHRKYFESDKEIILFSDLKDCTEKCLSILSMTKMDADEIRENARNKSISAGYRYEDRVNQILKYLSHHNEK